MSYVVTEDCIKCKYMDCVLTCPVDCFYEGENMLVIHPDQCIDCATCEAACPIDAIASDTDSRASKWISINREYSALWPKIVGKGRPPSDAKEWEGAPNKFVEHFSVNAGMCGVRTRK